MEATRSFFYAHLPLRKGNLPEALQNGALAGRLIANDGDLRDAERSLLALQNAVERVDEIERTPRIGKATGCSKRHPPLIQGVDKALLLEASLLSSSTMARDACLSAAIQALMPGFLVRPPLSLLQTRWLVENGMREGGGLLNVRPLF